MSLVSHTSQFIKQISFCFSLIERLTEELGRHHLIVIGADRRLPNANSADIVRAGPSTRPATDSQEGEQSEASSTDDSADEATVPSGELSELQW